MKVFKYSVSDLYFQVVEAEAICAGKSEFDGILEEKWEELQARGLFRYIFKQIPFKVLPGKFQFIAQLNPDRAEKRRKPQSIKSLSQPFNPNDFNFTDANKQEIIISLEPWWSQNEPKDHQNQNIIMINVSPLEYGHVLIIPQIQMKHSQKISLLGLRLALDTILLSKSRDFRVGFNSLCAYASVNHQHFHAYYLRHRLHIEFMESYQYIYQYLLILSNITKCYFIPMSYEKFCFLVIFFQNEDPNVNFLNDYFGDKVIYGHFMHQDRIVQALENVVDGILYKTMDYPGKGFAFILKDEIGLEKFLENVYKLTSYLQDCDVAHNMFITRGSSKNQVGHFDSIRLFVWARTPSYGAKASEAFNPALCELAGHFPIKSEPIYESISEDLICTELSEICSKPFDQLYEQIISLYTT